VLKFAVVEYSILKAVSSVELSTQLKFTCDDEAAVAETFVGGSKSITGTVGVGVGVGIGNTVTELPELVAPLLPVVFTLTSLVISQPETASDKTLIITVRYNPIKLPSFPITQFTILDTFSQRSY
jgi:hypothetical protein